MATIKRAQDAPEDLTHFSLGQADFDLEGADASYETDDPSVIADANVNPFLTVEQEVAAPEEQPDERDPNDPHVNPAADHLSIWASQEAKDAAAANDAAIAKAAGVDRQRVTRNEGNPSVAEAVGQTFETVEVDGDPQFAGGEVEPQTASSTEATPPAGDPDPQLNSWESEGGK